MLSMQMEITPHGPAMLNGLTWLVTASWSRVYHPEPPGEPPVGSTPLLKMQRCLKNPMQINPQFYTEHKKKILFLPNGWSFYQ